MFEIGNTLREARLRRGLDILDCEAETKIRAKYLRAMEEEQFDLMPSPTYVRGFLRAYADFLDLDGRLVLDEYESRFGEYAPSIDGDRGQGAAGLPRRGAHRPAPRRAPAAPAAPAPAAHRGPAPVARHRRRHDGGPDHLARGGRERHRRPPSRTPRPPTTSTSAAPRDRRARHGGHRGAGARQEDRHRPHRARAPTGAGSRSAARRATGGWSTRAPSRPATSQTFKVVDGIWLRAANPAELNVTVAGKVKDLGNESGSWRITPTEVRSVG